MSKHKKHEKKSVKKKDIQPSEIPESNNSNSNVPHSAIQEAKQKIDEAKNEASQLVDTATQKAKEFAHNAEQKINEVSKKAKEYVSWQWKADFKELEKETVSKVNKVAEGVEHLGEGYEDLVESIFPNDHTWSKIIYTAEWNESVDRWVVARVLWCIVLRPVMLIRWAWIALLWIIFMIKIVITGKRDRKLWNKLIRFANYVLNWDAYMWGLIDRRPEIVE